MEILRDAKNFICRYDKISQLMVGESKIATSRATSKEMRQDVEDYVELIEQYKPVYFIYDQRNNRYIYKLDEQKWVSIMITGAFVKVKIKKVAFVYPQELIAKLALRQVVDASEQVPYERKYFSDEAEAMEWLGL